MKLPDFTEFKPLKNLVEEMGATYKTAFQVSWDKLNEDDIEEKLRTSGLNVDFDEIQFNERGFSTYKNRIVLFYIKTQLAKYYYSGYKFHFSKCSTISTAIQENRNSRYVISKRTDGLFDVILQDGFNEDERQIELKPCRNCLREVNYNGYAVGSKSKRDQIYNFFDINELLEGGIGGIDLGTMSLFRDSDKVGVDKYPDNFDSEVRPRELKRHNYTCNACRIRLHKFPKYLHVHHINGDKSWNSYRNLQLLCIECHSKLPKHELVRQSRDYLDFQNLKKSRKFIR